MGYVFWWLEGVIGDGKGKGRGWNETREGVEGNKGGGEEESMNYPYIISTLFVLVWVDSG